MNTAVRILCIHVLPRYHHKIITDLLMNRHRLPVRQRILFKVLVINYQPFFLFYNARDLRSNNKLLIKPCPSVARIKEYGKRPIQHAALMSGMNYPY